jgi:FKBP-type peptidyl-prolyl cis-trans isomerase SlyD
MDFAGNYKFFGNTNVEVLQHLLASKSESAWLDGVALSSQSHRQSRNIFLKNDIKPEHLYGCIHQSDSELNDAAMEVVKNIQQHFPDGYLVRLQFVRHLPDTGFKLHDDSFSFTLMNSHRIHVPIFSDNKFLFTVGGEEKYMEEGEIWEINNTRPHSGHNHSQKTRVSLIGCIARPLYTANDRVDFFMNLESTSMKDGLVRCRPKLEMEAEPGGIYLGSNQIVSETSRVAKGVVVSINYKLTDLKTNQVLSENSSNEPMSFLYGFDQLPPKFESSLIGLKIGDNFSCPLAKEEAYGAYSAELNLEIADRLYSQKPIHGGVDMKLLNTVKTIDSSYAQLISSVVHAMHGKIPLIYRLNRGEGARVLIDTNHPYAGKNLEFSGTIASIRSLSQDENQYAIYQGPTLSSVESQKTMLASLGIYR